MKLFIICCLLMGALLFAVSPVCAQDNAIVLDASNFPKPEPRKRQWRVENTTEWSTGSDFENKTHKIEGSNISNSTYFTSQSGDYKFRLGGGINTGTNRDPDKVIGTVEFQVSRSFQNVDAVLKSSVSISSEMRLGQTSLKISKAFHLAEGTEISIFTMPAIAYKLDNSNNRATNGIYNAAGSKFEGEISSTEVEIITQVIADSGAIRQGKRVAGNVELVWLFSIPKTHDRFKAGPKLDYTNFLWADYDNHLENRNVFHVGIVFEFR